jgi:hypothetical protein
MREVYLEDLVEDPGLVTREMSESFSNPDVGLVMVIVKLLEIVHMCIWRALVELKGGMLPQDRWIRRSDVTPAGR